MISGYPNDRKKNCETGVLGNMLAWHGYEISEGMLFGIGSGLYFMYSPILAVSGTIYPLLRLPPVEIVKRAAERLHLNVRVKSFGNNRDSATIALERLLEKNIPVGVVVNVKGLPYFNVSGVESDFNGHIVAVIGKEGTDYILADTDSRLSSDDYVRAGESIMREIRFAPGIAAPHGKMFWLDPSSDYASQSKFLKTAVVSGLKETCNKFLRVPLPGYGVKGLHAFAKDIRKWEERYSFRQIAYVLMWYYRLIERAGTGGSGYRYIYLDFLKEAATLFESDVLQDSTDTMAMSAEHWRLFCLECRRFIRNPENTSLKTMADIMDQIGAYECETFYRIKKGFVSRWE